MGAYTDFARIFWLDDIDGMAWAANCGAMSDPEKPFPTATTAASDLVKHYATCEECEPYVQRLGEKGIGDL